MTRKAFVIRGLLALLLSYPIIARSDPAGGSSGSGPAASGGGATTTNSSPPNPGPSDAKVEAIPAKPNDAKFIDAKKDAEQQTQDTSKTSVSTNASSKESTEHPLIHDAVNQDQDELSVDFNEGEDKPVPLRPLKDLKIQTSKKIELYSRGTEVVNLPQAAAQVLVTDPKIADVQLATPNTLYVYGRLPGTTEIMVTGNDLESAYRYDVIVKSDISELQKVIKMMAPTEHIRAIPLPDGVMLQGTVDSPKIAEDVRQVAQRYVGQSGNVVNMIKAKNAIQINLRVKIAEVKRTVINTLNINWGAVTSPTHFRFGLLQGNPPFNAAVPAPVPGGPIPQDTIGQFTREAVSSVIPSSLGLRFTDKINDFASLIDALAHENLATVLAEPNLVTVSGEEASFLAGGEYPFTVAQGVGSAATVTIQFKPYGISLSFIPTVVGDTIILRVRPEVSELDTSNSVRDQLGNLIPALTTRRADSTLQMGNGESMVMAGLLSNVSRSSIEALPGLGDLPVLGALFRSNDFQSDKTELVIVVTPYIVQPIENPKDVVLPTQGLKYSRLFDKVLDRRINDPSAALKAGQKPTFVGDAGFNF